MTDRDFMLELFRPGGGLKIVGPNVTVPPSQVANYSSVNDCREFMESQIQAEIDASFVVEVPFKPRKLNALGAVPKGPGKWRRITDLSKPEGTQLNAFTEPTKFQFASIDDAVCVIRRFKHVRLSKFDISNAFRHIMVVPEHWDLQGFEWNGKFYIDLRMCFGLSIAPYTFWRISNFIAKVASAHYGVEFVVPYMDDFLIISVADSEAEVEANAARDFAAFRNCLTDMGWQINEDKVVHPSKSLTFLGIAVDIDAHQLSVPEAKLKDMLLQLESFRGRRHATKREVEKLVGRLNFAAKVVRGGRTFLRRMINVINSVGPHDARVTLGDEFRADVDWWLRFAPTWNGHAIMLDQVQIDARRFVVDTSKLACAAAFDLLFIVRVHDALTLPWHINDKELLSIYLAALQWGSEWKNRHVVVSCDNTTAVAAINKGSSRSPLIMRLLRDLFWQAVTYNFHFTAVHLAGNLNTLADAISRGKFSHPSLIGLSIAVCPKIPSHVVDG